MIRNAKNKNKIYMCHFPGHAIKLQNKVINYVINEKFTIDKNITMISVVNKPYLEKSFLPLQCKLLLSKKALEAVEWNMTNKIDYILECLYKCKTKYAVISDCSDVVLTANLDEEFINKFLNTKYDILYNASTMIFPKKNCLGDKYLKGGSEKFCHLNAGVCIGYTDKLIEWYEHCKVVKKEHPFNIDEQFVIRTALSPKYNVGIDGNTNLFFVAHKSDTEIEIDNDLFIGIKNKEKILLDTMLNYDYINLIGKRVVGRLNPKDIQQIGYINDRIIIYYVNNLEKDIPKLKKVLDRENNLDPCKNELFIILNKKSNKIKDFSLIKELIFSYTRQLEIVICDGFKNYELVYELIYELRNNLKYVDLSDLYIDFESIRTCSCLEFYYKLSKLDNVECRLKEFVSKKTKYIGIFDTFYIFAKEKDFKINEIFFDNFNFLFKKYIKQAGLVEAYKTRKITFKNRIKIGGICYLDKCFIKKS